MPVEIFLNVVRQNREDCLKFIAGHREILEALENRDAERLKTVLIANIKGGFDVIEKTYSRMVGIST